MPRTLFAEQSGTYVNNEGRVQYADASIDAAGESRPLRTIAEDLARMLGGRLPALKKGESALGDLAEAIPALAATIQARRENRAALVRGVEFKTRGFVEIPDHESVFAPEAGTEVRDPDDCLGLAAALEIKSLRTARRR